MEDNSFVDFLHKDGYSVRNGIGDTKDAIKLLKERNQKYYVVANYGELSGWIDQYFNCIKNEIIPILGIEIFVNNYRVSGIGNEIKIKKLDANERWEKDLYSVSDDERSLVQIDYNLALFARNMDGYYNIIKIHNDAQINGMSERPRTNDDFLKDHGNGIVAVMPTPYSEISSLVFNGMYNEAINKYNFYKSIFDDVYMAITLVDDKEYSKINDEMILFCQKHGIKMIPVLNSHYLTKNDEHLYQTFLKMQKIKTTVKCTRVDVDVCPGMFYRNLDETYELWKNTFKSEVFNEMMFAKLNFNLKVLLSTFSILPLDTTPKTPTFPNSSENLRKLAYEGLKKRGKEGQKEYIDRVEYELDNIIKAGFADYFILLEDLCRWCWSHGVQIGTGRGCFLPNQKVTMSDFSIKNIQDVNENDFVYTGDRNKKKVLNTFQYNVDEEIVELTLLKIIDYENNYKENKIKLQLTTNHEIWINYYDEKQKKWNVKWIEAKDVNVQNIFKPYNQFLINIQDDKQWVVIKKEFKRYCGTVYDLNVQDDHNYIVNGFKVHNSAGGSLVLFLLNVTQVDPIKYNLLFERFLDSSRLDDIINKGGKVSGCFSEDTYVAMSNREFKYIKDVNVGDKIIGIDGKDYSVVRVLNKGIQETWRLTYSNGNDSYYFDVTWGHKLPVIDLKGNKKEEFVYNIRKGYKLIESDNVYWEVSDIKYKDCENVYDLEIENKHYYRVCGRRKI